MKTLDELLADTVEVNCLCCQGHSFPGSKEGEHGHCPVCGGLAVVRKSAYASLTDAQRVDVLEAEVMRLRPDLAARYRQTGVRR